MTKQYSRDYLIGLAYKLNQKHKTLSRETYEVRTLLYRLTRVVGKTASKHNKFDDQVIKETEEILLNGGNYDKKRNIYD